MIRENSFQKSRTREREITSEKEPEDTMFVNSNARCKRQWGRAWLT